MSNSTPRDQVGADAATPEAEKRTVPLQRRQELEQLLRTNPTNLDAFTELAAIYRAEERHVDARRILRQALEVFPGHGELQYQYEEAVLARSLQQLREVNDLATRLDTPETDRELDRSTMDWAMRRMEVCQARLDRDPSALHLYVQLAEARFDADQFEEAIQTAAPVLHHDDYAPAAHLLVGRSHLALGNELEALKSLRACAMRRAVAAPLAIRIVALRLLCETAERLNLSETLAMYQNARAAAEHDLSSHRRGGESSVATSQATVSSSAT